MAITGFWTASLERPDKQKPDFMRKLEKKYKSCRKHVPFKKCHKKRNPLNLQKIIYYCLKLQGHWKKRLMRVFHT